nr:uncharacterized protein LOC101243210 isoform X3 [Ciona intestinalis]|eukprot:XP_009859580.1 uncharacterized protein LOC101243210 isoform X3 [Ciona intestinalis]
MAKANTEVIIEIFQENTKFPAAACYARNAKTAEIQNTTTESAIALKDSPPLKKVKSKQQTTVVNKWFNSHEEAKMFMWVTADSLGLKLLNCRSNKYISWKKKVYCDESNIPYFTVEKETFKLGDQVIRMH